MRIAGLLLLLAALAAAQPDQCSIEGKVVNALTGEPVRKASVTLRPAETNRVGPAQSYAGRHGRRRTVQDERAESRQVPAVGSAQRLRRHRVRRARAGRPGTAIAVSPGQQLKDVSLRLTPHAVVTGRVMDEDGEPVARVQISLLRFRYFDGRKQLMAASGETTNDLGEYRVFWLAARQVLRQRRQPLRHLDGTGRFIALPFSRPEEDYVPTYYPGTTDAAAAAAIDVQPGAQLRGIDFALSKARTVRVRGRVTLPAETAPGNVNLMLHPRGGCRLRHQPQCPDGPAGRFRVSRRAPGAYTVVAVFQDGDGMLTRGNRWMWAVTT